VPQPHSRIHGPKRNVRKHDDRVLLFSCFTSLKPFELSDPRGSQSTRLEVYHVDQTDKVRSLVIEAVPAFSFRAFAEAVQVLLAIVRSAHVFAGNVEDLSGLGALEYLLGRVKLGRFDSCEISPRVHRKSGGAAALLMRSTSDLERHGYIRVSLFAEPDVESLIWMS